MRSRNTSERLVHEKKRKVLRRIVKIGLACLFVLGLIGVAAVQICRSALPHIAPAVRTAAASYLSIREFVVTGASEFTDREIRAYVEPILRVNPNLVTLPLPAIRSFLASRPYLSGAEIRKEFPGRIVIAVKEKKTVAVLVRNGFHLLDENGDVLRPMSMGENIDVPVVTVEEPIAEAALKEMLKTACCLIQMDNRSLPYLMPSELRVTQSGIVLRSPDLKNSDNVMPPVYFGFEGLEKKVLYVKKLWPEILKKKNEIEYIDGRFRQGVVVKLKTTEVKYNG